jgi:hypothetical protein
LLIVKDYRANEKATLGSITAAAVQQRRETRNWAFAGTNPMKSTSPIPPWA